MIARWVFAAVAAITLAGAGPRTREAEIGSLITRPAAVEIADHGYTPEQRGRVAMAQYARCKFGRTPRRVSEYLQLPTAESLANVHRLATEDCLVSGELKFQSSQMRGYLFGEMYRLHEGMPPQDWKYPITPLDLVNSPADDAQRDLRVNFMLLTMTDCLHKADPALVRDVVLNAPASIKQKAAYRSLIPKLSACVPKGMNFELSRSVIESAFGEYLYRSLVPVIAIGAGNPR